MSLGNRIDDYTSREQLHSHRIKRLIRSYQLNLKQPSAFTGKRTESDTVPLGNIRGPIGNFRGPLSNAGGPLCTIFGSLGRALRGPVRFFYLFMEISSIHGFNHLTTRKRHVLEHVLWLGAMCAGFYGFSHISLATLNRYTHNPTVISLERNYMDWNTTLPAATVCPVNKYDQGALDKVVERSKYATLRQAQFGYYVFDFKSKSVFYLTLTAVQLTRSKSFKSFFDEGPYERLNISKGKEGDTKDFLKALAGLSYKNLRLLADVPEIATSDYLQAVVDMRFHFESQVGSSFVHLNGQDLVLTLTELGVCYSFNSRIAIFTNPEAWQSGNYTHPTTEYALEGSPLDGDIFIQLLEMKSEYEVYLHSPDDVPDITSRYDFAQLKTYLTMNVDAISIVSTPQVRDSLSIEQRKCRFPHESNLKISSKYSYNLCRMECRMMLALERCGCVPFFYKPSADYKVCDFNGIKCLEVHSDLLMKLVDKDGHKVECNCLPTCDDVNYVIEFKDMLEWNLGTNLRWGMVKYPRERFIRDVIFGVTDVLVALGGTAGFFFGCSVLSLVEILYFFTLRLWWFVSKK